MTPTWIRLPMPHDFRSLLNRRWSALRLTVVCLVLGGAGSLASSQSIRDYAILVRGEPAGRLLINTTDPTWTESDMRFSDNGRGPQLYEHWRHDSTGRPTTYTASGQSTFGAAIEEQFQFDGAGRLTWRSRVDQGNEPAAADQVFVPMEPSPAMVAQIAAHVLARPDRRAPLRGGSEARAELVRTTTLKAGAGEPVPIALVAVTGIDSDPWFVWLENRPGYPLFASLDTRIQIIASGHEASAAALIAEQLQAEDARWAALQKKLAIPLQGITLIHNARWFDPHAMRLEGPSDLWLHDGRIASITRPDNARIVPDHRIDASGHTLLPGLIDTHVHYSADQGFSRLAAGVTTVRDMGGNNERVRTLQQRLARGEMAGPTVVAAGFIEGRSRFSSRNGFVVDTLDEARSAVRWYAANGYRTLKLYSSIRPEWVDPIIRMAKRRGLRVTGHVPAFMRAEDAVLAGYDELAHINQVLLNFVSRPGDDNRTLDRFTRVGDDAQFFRPQGAEARRFIDLLKARGTVVDPTLVAFESMYTQQQREPNPSFSMIAEHLPAQWQRELRAADFDLEGPRLVAYQTAFERMLQMTAELHRSGVPLITGTDSPHGLSLHRELELYVRAGISPSAALRASTLEAARALGEQDRRGSIERGRIADLVLVAGDPTTQIADIRRTALVIQGTTAWQPARIYRALGIRPFADALAVDGSVSDD